MASSTVIAEFTQHHNFRIPEFLTEDEQAILWLHDIKSSIDESASAHSQRLLTEEDPSWAMLLTMLERVYEHAAASVVSYFTGTWASMEVIVRATVEAAATVIYVTRSDRHVRLGQYLTHYFVSARPSSAVTRLFAPKPCRTWRRERGLSDRSLPTRAYRSMQSAGLQECSTASKLLAWKRSIGISPLFFPGRLTTMQTRSSTTLLRAASRSTIREWSLLQARNCGIGCVSTFIPDCVITASRRTATPAR
jgi:hypothetical protein